MSESNLSPEQIDFTSQSSPQSEVHQEIEYEKPQSQLVPLNNIIPDLKQARKEFPEAEIEALAESIKLNGLITPILVVSTGENSEVYKLVDGERRYRAFKELQKKNKGIHKYDSIPALILEKDMPINGILANMARKIYNPMESAEALKYIKEHSKLTDEQLGKLVEKSRSSISEYLSLMDLPDEIKDTAKLNSIVPFRELKKLVAYGSTAEEKIARYTELEEKYKTKGKRGPKKEGSKTACKAERLAQGLKKDNVQNFAHI